ncbi:MAG: guanylate kinase [Tannerella sp.]|jgi:guanylate kinase|nr:guanylate kinase [Tannerella sp.]
MNKEGKVILFSAPSGSGKSTIIHHLLQQGLPLQFSISATSRPPRSKEQDGVDYYFMTPELFQARVNAGDFLEYEEVYPGSFYGTLKSEVDRISNAGCYAVFDVDVAGGCRIKACYGAKALAVFIQPPSLEELRKRLENRGAESPEVIRKRLEKAAYELSFAPKYDVVITNDRLEQAQEEVLRVVQQFIGA